MSVMSAKLKAGRSLTTVKENALTFRKAGLDPQRAWEAARQYADRHPSPVKPQPHGTNASTSTSSPTPSSKTPASPKSPSESTSMTPSKTSTSGDEK